MKLKELKIRFTEETEIEAKAKYIRPWLKENGLEELLKLDLRKKDTWITLLDAAEELKGDILEEVPDSPYDCKWDLPSVIY